MSETLKKHYPLIFSAVLISLIILGLITSFIEPSGDAARSQFGDAIPAIFAEQQEPVVLG